MREAGTIPEDGGAINAAIRKFDWASTPLGSRNHWPAALTATYEMMMASPFAMCVGWGPELTFLYNEAYVDFLAARHPAALGQPIKQVWHDVWADIEPLIRKAMAGERVRFTDMHLVMTRKGYPEDTYWTFAYSALKDGADVVGFLNVAIETTDGVVAGQHRDAAEAGLRELNVTLEQQVAERTRDRNQIWQVSRDMLLIADLEGRWLSVNPAWSRLLGWEEQEFIGRTSDWVEHPEDQAKTRAEIKYLAQGHTTNAFENRFRTKDGNYRTLAWTAVSAGGLIYCVARDVTDDRQRAAASRLFQHIVESDVSPVVAFDTDMRLVAFNKAHSDAYRRVYGIEQKVGDSLLEQFLPDQAAVVRGFMGRALSGESFIVREPFGDPALDKPYWEISYNPLRDENGRIIGGFHHAVDITAELRAANELGRTQEALRQSQKMEAVGQLTGGLAHDFNNLLAGISGSLDLMQRRIDQGRVGEISRYMTGAQEAAKRAAALTHRLLAFSRRQTLAPKPTDVDRLVAGMEDMVKRTVGPEIAVEFHTTSDLWPTLVDPNQLENALLNLCINARDAMPDGGQIAVETSNRTVDDHSAAERDMPPGDYVSLSVTDNGVGMPPEIVERIFEPFFTTKPIGVGTGLGLSMIYGFAKQSGGQVRVHSQVGKGTTVTMFLPRHGTAEITVRNAEIDTADRQAKVDETVLVIDDEPLVRMLIVDVLEELGYRALEAGDGPEGLKLLRSNIRIDLLITDVGLPKGMNGRQVADAARELRPGLKVLFVTGYAENAVLSHGHLEPGMQVVTKPFVIATLTKIVQGLISGQNT